jgi:hypothetical protein
MDINTMYAAANVGLQDDYETQIIKEVWQKASSDMSNFTKADFEKEDNICEKVYEAQGSTAYGMCYNAAISANTAAHNALIGRYAEAQVKGYQKDFESFKKKSSTLGALGNLAEGILGGLLGDKRRDGTSNDSSVSVGGGGTYQPPEKSKLGLYIGLGAVALVGIGTAIYFFTRKK